jgi:hypothetical protein
LRRSLPLALLFGLVSFGPRLGAQTVRGTIVVESTGLPVGSALVTLVGTDGVEIPPGVRSDTVGGFVLHAARPGRYRVKATRIGFRPLTSDIVSLGPGELVVVRLRMTTVAQELVPVRIVERRPLNLSELMSTAGYDLRQSKGVGRFVDAERLATYGLDGGGEVLRNNLRPAVEFTDGPDGTFMWMRTPPDTRTGLPGQCLPEIYLDGSLLSEPRDSGTGRPENAFAMLEAYPAKELYGIEVYKGSEVPPPSLGGLFGDRTFDPTKPPCGVVAVWTKKGRKLAGNAPRGVGLSGIQVIRGTMVDFDTDKPVAGVRVTLVSETGTRLAEDVLSDSLGEFTIRTRRVGPLRLESGDLGRGPKTTPTFQLSPEELVMLKLFVSAKTPVMAPLGIRARALPASRAVTDPASFSYRRERGITGVFFGAEDIQRRGVRTLADLIRGIDGITITGAAPSDTIAMRNTVLRSRPTCPPAFFVNGTRLIAGVDSTVRSLAMDRLLGVEVYTLPSSVPAIHAHEVDDCGMIGIWIRER